MNGLPVRRIRVRTISTPHREGTVIGLSASSWHVHWDGVKYGINEYGSIARGEVNLIDETDA